MENQTSDSRLIGGHRVFYELPPAISSNEKSSKHLDKDSLLNFIYKNVIGNHKLFITPFGERKMIYCDYTASGRSLTFIEDYIRMEVLPDYGNTHTTTSITSLQTTLFRHEARDIIRNAVRASDHDAVLFIGSGCTGAIHKLVHCLQLNKPPVVLVGPYEHHSNILPWRHLAHKIIRITSQTNGGVSLQHLEEVLIAEKELCQTEKRALLCCFAAASNITGILVDVDRISHLVHTHNGLVFWDYAAAAPYVAIDMNPVSVNSDIHLIHKDAIYFSFHKFVGGVQTPGCLVVKKRVMQSSIVQPESPGGGTVFFVSRRDQLYLQDVEIREEGGTPAIVESIRAGLVMQLKERVGSDFIMQKEALYTQCAWDKFSTCPNLVILGGSGPHRLPIFSFLIRFPSTGGSYLFLHYSFVCTLLNDLFGIQARGGCACAGPYAFDLLGLSDETAQSISDYLVGSGLDPIVLSKYLEYPHREVFRPGFTRINLPYFLPPEEVNFVLESVCFVAEHGWKLLPRYKYHPVSGEWNYQGFDRFDQYKWLGHISYTDEGMQWRRNSKNHSTGNHAWPALHSDGLTEKAYYAEAMQVASEIVQQAIAKPIFLTSSVLDAEASQLRWFALPTEAGSLLWPHHASAEVSTSQVKSPFQPGTICPCTEGGNDVIASTLDQDPLSKLDLIILPPKPHFSQMEHISSVQSFSRKPLEKIPSPINGSSKREKRQLKQLWKLPPKEIFKPFLTAVNEFNMIQEGDRVLVCLSGGKDSLSLLHALKQYQHHRAAMSKSQPAKWPPFELGACTVDPGSSGYNPRPLIPYLQQLNVPYFYESQDIMDAAKNLPTECASICSFCSRMKRGRLYHVARREGYNVLAMGHHLDDLSESFLMSVFHNGLLRTMKANYFINENQMRLIRPFIYVREKYLRVFADKNNLPVIPENCPACFNHPKERFRVKQLLAEQEAQFPDLYNSLLSSMKPLMALQSYQKLTCNAAALLPSEEEEDLP